MPKSQGQKSAARKRGKGPFTVQREVTAGRMVQVEVGRCYWPAVVVDVETPLSILACVFTPEGPRTLHADNSVEGQDDGERKWRWPEVVL